jgi:hypothetical protein
MEALAVEPPLGVPVEHVENVALPVDLPEPVAIVDGLLDGLTDEHEEVLALGLPVTLPFTLTEGVCEGVPEDVSPSQLAETQKVTLAVAELLMVPLEVLTKTVPVRAGVLLTAGERDVLALKLALRVVNALLEPEELLLGEEVEDGESVSPLGLGEDEKLGLRLALPVGEGGSEADVVCLGDLLSRALTLPPPA